MRLIAPAVASVVASSSLVACGGADLSLVAAAAERTEEARTARVEVTSGVEGVEPVRGVADFSERLLEFETVLGRFVFHDSVMYMSVPEDLQHAADGKPWTRSDLNEETSPGGDSIFGFFDPTQILRSVREAADVEEVGREEVRGISTIRYRGTIDFATYAAEFTLGEFASVADDAAGQVTVEVWVGGDGLLRRVSYDIPPVEDLSPSSLMFEFYDLGEDVEIAIPPDDQVYVIS